MEEVVHILGFGFDPKIIIFGFGIGLLVGLTGMGGASLMTPLLILVFGIQPVTAIGTDIFYGAVTKTVGGYKHLKLGTVHRGLAFWLAVGSVPAAITGVWVIEFLQNHYGDDVGTIVLGMLGGTLVVVGVATLLRSLFLAGVIQERSALHLYRRHIIAAVVTGALTGFVIGLTSAGSGTLIAIALIAIFRLTPQRVVGTDVFHAAVLLWAAGFAHWVGGNIDFALAATILLGSIPGVILGTNLSVKAPQRVLRYALAVVLMTSGTTLIINEGTPGVVIPAIIVASLMVGLLFAAQAISRSRARGARRAPAGAPA
ncbi:MAG TPA: sulfite exporter TauE/SafE family protein [Solirubrobacterales bacterium]|nr:sulfite exporter TauE/SafE family protein [Solirubrobacterales bacterium]